MKHQSLLIPLLVVGLTLATSSVSDDSFVYTGFAGSNLTLDGMATVTPRGLLQLTNGTGQLKGHAFHPDPLRFRKLPDGAGTVRSFSVSFVFAILSIYPNLSSQGMAFFVCPSKNLSAAAPRGFLGLFNSQNDGNISNHIFAVELDTIQNTDFKDISDNHVGIDVNSIRSVQSYDTGYYDNRDGGFRNLTLNSHEAMQVWIDYHEESTQISVTIAPLKASKPIRPLVSATYNLSTVLTDQAYAGFSASTGTIDSQHYVLGWSFGMGRSAPAIDIGKLPKLPREALRSGACTAARVEVVATAMALLFFY